ARSISRLVEGRDGTVWVGTAAGVYRLDRTGAVPRLAPVAAALSNLGPAVLDLLEDTSGSLWVASFAGLSRRWPDGSTARYTKNDGLPDVNVHTLFQDREGRLWAGTRLGGFFGFHADDTHAAPEIGPIYATRDGLGADWVFRLFETSDRRFWIATNRGIAQF